MGGPIISAVDEGTVVPVPSVAVLNYHEVHPPAHLDPNPKMETYRRKAKCNTCNTNPFSTYPQVSRRSGSSKGVAGAMRNPEHWCRALIAHVVPLPAYAVQE